MTLGFPASISTERPVTARTFVISVEFLVADEAQWFGSIVRSLTTNTCHSVRVKNVDSYQ